MIDRVRPSAKALIIQDGRLLCIHQRDEAGDYFTLPGGGQESGETLPEALRRECREEIGADVIVGALRFVREYIGRNHEFAAEEGHRHQLDLIFACELAPGSVVGNGSLPDTGQLGVRWLPLDALERCRFYPRAVAAALLDGEPTYLGDVN